MTFPWEAILTLTISLIGFIAWLTKISVLQDQSLDRLSEIKLKIGVIEATFVTESELAREIGRIEQSVTAAHKRIDEIKKKEE